MELRKDKTHFEMKKETCGFSSGDSSLSNRFFNSLNKEFDAIFYFEFGDVLEQSFAQDELRGRLNLHLAFWLRDYSGLRILGRRFSRY